MIDMEHKLTFSDVTKSYYNNDKTKATKVIDGLSFEVKESEFFCIVGPSGCGKSTIINLAAGFIFPDSGSILENNQTIKGTSSARTVVFQEYALFPWKTVYENISFGLEVQGIKEKEQQEIIGDLLQKVKLEQFSDRYPNELSGGMKQRVALARAFAIKPDMILMDEPFASLDQCTRDLMQEELLNFRQNFSQTVIFVTHNIEEALFLGDRILVLTQRPTKTKTIINVPFTKPRLPDLRNYAEFTELKHKIWHLLRE